MQMKNGAIQKQRENSDVSGLTDQKYRHCRLCGILLSNFRVYYFFIVLCIVPCIVLLSIGKYHRSGGQILVTQVTT